MQHVTITFVRKYLDKKEQNVMLQFDKYFLEIEIIFKTVV